MPMISLNYGLNQYAKTFKDAYRRPDQRQAMSVTFSIPVFQWGINRNKLKIARNEYEAILLEQEYTLDNFKEEIHDNIFDYNMSRELMDVSGEKYELSAQQYAFAAMRFKVGKMAAIELTDANRDYLQAKQNYISVLKGLFISYYKIRHLALYDFMEGKDMVELIRKSVVKMKSQRKYSQARHRRGASFRRSRRHYRTYADGMDKYCGGNYHNDSVRYDCTWLYR